MKRKASKQLEPRAKPKQEPGANGGPGYDPNANVGRASWFGAGLWNMMPGMGMLQGVMPGMGVPGAPVPRQHHVEPKPDVMMPGPPHHAAALVHPPAAQNPAAQMEHARRMMQMEMERQRIAEEKRKDALEQEMDADVGLSHIDADEQTFCEYDPSLFGQQPFCRHPDVLHETTCLSSLIPPKTNYKLCISSQSIVRGLLTSAQLESVALACAQHDLRLPGKGCRSAFFLGDGPGVGKGRQVSGMIYENFLRGRRRALWLSVSADLVADARRDLRDIGAGGVRCFHLRESQISEDLSQKSEMREGVLFCTYSLLVSSNAHHSRLEQIIKWCGGASFDGVLALDECHRAKKMGRESTDKPKDALSSRKQSEGTQAAKFVALLQERLPSSRIIYVSATGASDPRHFQNMSRLGLWGPGTSFRDSSSFIQEINKGGVGAMELVAMHMKANGQYLSRSLSFKGAEFVVEQVQLDAEFSDMYDQAVELWVDVISAVRNDCVRWADRKRNMTSLLWGAHQRFFSQLVMSAKVKTVVALVKAAVAAGKCCVIGLQSTGEASAGKNAGQSLDADQVCSTAKFNLASLLEQHCAEMAGKEDLLERLEGLRLPQNPLDCIIDELGGAGMVAEMTGRKARYERREGKWRYVRRAQEGCELSVNIEERMHFQAGRKLVAVISEAASSGISLQADRTVENQRRRVHITLQLPWSADQAVQQMGRSHRSNQSSSPEFVLLMTPIGGEWRFASAVARRLQTLGALTQGDRRAGGTGARSLSSFNIEQKYGNKALELLYQVVFAGKQPSQMPAFVKEEYEDSLDAFTARAHDAMVDTGLSEADMSVPGNKLKRFLNRILGCPLQLQNHIFALFTQLMDEFIAKDKAENTYSEGIVDIASDNVKVLEEVRLYECPRTEASATFVRLQTDRGVSWSKALQLLEEQREYSAKNQLEDDLSGFWQSRQTQNQQVLALKQRQHGMRRKTYLHIIHPNTGHSPQALSEAQVLERYMKVAEREMESAEREWQRRHERALTHCGHSNGCGNANCRFRKRTTDHLLITGLVLPFWKHVREAIGYRPKVVRVQPTDGERRIVGLLICPRHIEEVKAVIKRGTPMLEEDGARNALVPEDPFWQPLATLAVHDCLSPGPSDAVKFELAEGWSKTNEKLMRNAKGELEMQGEAVSCVARLFEIPFQNALDGAASKLRCMRWQSAEQLLCMRQRGADATVISTPVGNRLRGEDKNGAPPLLPPVVLDTHVLEGRNRLEVRNVGERCCVVVQLAQQRSVDVVLQQMREKRDRDKRWGLELLAAGLRSDEDAVVVENLTISLNCPLALTRMQTPARGAKCAHVACFDLGSFLELAARHYRWQCPVCDAAIAPEELRPCAFTEDLLELVNQDKAVVHKDGTILNIDGKSCILDAAAPPARVEEDKAAQAAAPDASMVEAEPQAEVAGPVQQLEASGRWERVEAAETVFVDPGIGQQQQGEDLNLLRAAVGAGGLLCSDSSSDDDADQHADGGALMHDLQQGGAAALQSPHSAMSRKRLAAKPNVLSQKKTPVRKRAAKPAGASTPSPRPSTSSSLPSPLATPARLPSPSSSQPRVCVSGEGLGGGQMASADRQEDAEARGPATTGQDGGGGAEPLLEPAASAASVEAPGAEQHSDFSDDEEEARFLALMSKHTPARAK